jgi:Cd2+/Zn2+-exporting ATPase
MKSSMMPRTHALSARMILATSLLAISLGLYWKQGEAYGWSSGLYWALNGAVLLLAIPSLLRCLLALVREARVSADLLVWVLAGLAIGAGRLLEAAVIVVISLLADVLKAAAIRKVIKALPSAGTMENRRVWIKDGTKIRECSLQDLQKGQVVVVRQGQMIPVDGIIVSGKAEVREVSLTGEATFQVRIPGHRVLAGGFAESGSLEIRTERIGRETLVAHVERLVRHALERQTEREGFMDRFTRYYVSAIFILGLLFFVVYGQFMFASERLSSSEALHRALLVMLAVSPVGLIVAGPLAICAGLLRAARRGILFKGGDVLENLSRVTTLLLDKTGTLTYARPQVAGIKVFGSCTEEELIDAALFVEQHSGHPIACAICEYGTRLNRNGDTPDKFHEFEGGGACATKGERWIKVGALWLMEDGRDIPAEVTAWMDDARAHGYSPVLVADRSRILGGFLMEDTVREEARSVLHKLREAGVRKFVLITGDHAETATRVQQAVGADQVAAECMPDQKMLRLAEEQRHGRWVGMVGDGINDAPALAAADVGIAMSAWGNDLAIEAADVALLKNDLNDLYRAYASSRQTVQTIKFSLWFSILSNLMLLALAVVGRIDLLQGALLQIVIVLIVGVHSFMLYFRKMRE